MNIYRIKLAIIGIMTIMTLSLSGHALAACSGTGAKGQVLDGIAATGGDCAGNSLSTTVGSIVSVLSMVVGIVAIIMVIFAGFKYITAGGDSGKISSAKNTLIYALVGLAVAALAQVIVHFVLNASAGIIN